METVIRYRGRVVTDKEVVFIREFIARNPGDSRWMLSRKLCQAWGWAQRNGALRDIVCRGLLHLARAGHIELPPVRVKIVKPLSIRSAFGGPATGRQDGSIWAGAQAGGRMIRPIK
jgi:hypothetical protein